jgi:hypothetical protein
LEKEKKERKICYVSAEKSGESASKAAGQARRSSTQTEL